MIIKVSKEQAKRFLITKQLLCMQPKSGYDGIKFVFDSLRVVQYDPLNPCGRNPDLVLQARVANYHPGEYEQWLYDKRQGIESYDKLLCIIPIEDLSYTNHNVKKVKEYYETKIFFSKKKREFEELLLFIEKNGPVSSKDIGSTERIPGTGWHGKGERWGKIALEVLWRTGQVVISKRIKGTKYYDIPHKVYQDNHSVVDRELGEEHILRRVNSVGMLSLTRSEGAWNGLGETAKVSAIIKTLIENGDLTVVEIEDVKTKYLVLTKDIAIFEAKPNFRNEMIFIAPLDTFVWDRRLIEEIFGFRYRWEVYVPASKRVYGYYVLPILYKDKFVGRIEPVLQGKTLIIKNLWKEDGVNWTKAMDKKLDAAINKFREYLKDDVVTKGY